MALRAAVAFATGPADTKHTDGNGQATLGCGVVKIVIVSAGYLVEAQANSQDGA